MPYHYMHSQEVAHRIHQINLAAHQRNLVLLATGTRRRKASQRVLRVIGWTLIHIGQRLYQQAEAQTWQPAPPPETACC